MLHISYDIGVELQIRSNYRINPPLCDGPNSQRWLCQYNCWLKTWLLVNKLYCFLIHQSSRVGYGLPVLFRIFIHQYVFNIFQRWTSLSYTLFLVNKTFLSLICLKLFRNWTCMMKIHVFLATTMNLLPERISLLNGWNVNHFYICNKYTIKYGNISH